MDTLPALAREKGPGPGGSPGTLNRSAEARPVTRCVGIIESWTRERPSAPEPPCRPTSAARCSCTGRTAVALSTLPFGLEEYFFERARGLGSVPRPQVAALRVAIAVAKAVDNGIGAVVEGADPVYFDVGEHLAGEAQLVARSGLRICTPH